MPVEMLSSKSCREERSSSFTNKYRCFSNGGKSEAEVATSPANQQPPVMMRSYSTSSYNAYKIPTIVKDDTNSKSKRSNKVKKKKGFKGLCEAEIQRKKRVAAYNVYGVEGRVKGSVKKSFKWFKETCSNAVYGLW